MFTKDDLVFSYTRAQAIEDGVLVDQTEEARGFGFKLPLAFTHAAWHLAVEWTEADTDRKPGLGQSTAGRLSDVLLMAFGAARQAQGDRAYFQVLTVPRHGDREAPEPVELVLHIGPGDTMEPVLTIMKPDED